jgi:hypothetical protein
MNQSTPSKKYPTLYMWFRITGNATGMANGMESRDSVKGLAPGKYILSAIRRYRKDYEHGNPPVTVYQKEVEIH